MIFVYILAPPPAPPSPVWRPSLPVLVDVQQELGRVHRRGGTGVQEQLLVLGQVLGRVLLGQPGAVEQLPLQERQVGLQGGEEGSVRGRKSLFCFDPFTLQSDMVHI